VLWGVVLVGAACAGNPGASSESLVDAPSDGAAEVAASPSAPTVADDARAEALQRASDATIGLLARALDGAASARTLGTHRIGSGVVIGSDGLVVTIGYLILEADDVDLELDDGRHIPARVVGYDGATGFGLVQALAPLGIQPAPLGNAGTVAPDDALLVVSGVRAGHAGLLSPAHLVQRREFAGYWEYHIRDALFTTPARQDHSGAGLFNDRGELVGIGSLLVADVADEAAGLPRDTHKPGNMFVPVDLLKPVLGELRASGSTRASNRAWLGLNCNARDGRLVVLRVSDGGPAQSAGIVPGDVILTIDGAPVHDLAEFYRRLWNEGPAVRAVKLDVERAGGERLQLTLQSVDRRSTIKHLDGI
jgi:S1-C subfamily serine protease